MRGLELHRPTAVVEDADKATATYGVFTAQPFERGWGVTIGNALRRIMLSSIEGAAIVAARFVGVSHEYDSIPGVMEDVTDLILNLKRVPLKLSGVESITATVKESGPGLLTTGSIQGGADLEIVDPNVHLATLSEEGTLEAELVVRRGRGFLPADEQDKRDLGVGFIFLDAAFSPVRKANFRIEPARVGQATDYEKLVLEVWTNGAISPAAAVAEAARLMSDHLPIFAMLEGTPAPAASEPADQMLEAGVETLEVSGRILNMLQNAGIATLRQLVAYSEDELVKVPGFGKKALAEVKEKIEKLGLSLGMRFDLPQKS
jgi:DNA-directed RNA polymerase subunit alpha